MRYLRLKTSPDCTGERITTMNSTGFRRGPWTVWEPPSTRRQVMSEQNYPKLQADYDSLRRKYRELKSNFDTLKSEARDTVQSVRGTPGTRERQGRRDQGGNRRQKCRRWLRSGTATKNSPRRPAGSVESQVRGTPEGVRGTQAPRQVQRGCDQGRRAQGSLPDAWSLSGYTPEGDGARQALITSSV